MRNKIKIILVAGLLSISFSTTRGYCQVDTTTYNVEDIINKIISESEDDTDLEGIINLIEDLAENPIDLNKSGISDFQKIPGVDLSAAELIIEHRKKYGNFYSVLELNSVKNIPSEIIKRIIPFVKVELYKTESFHNNNVNKFINSLEIRSRVVKDLQTEKGFIDNKFYGDRYKTYSRIKLNIKNKLNVGVTIDKDPGEKSINDLTSAYFSINNSGIFNKVVIGDYLVEFGQGLALWSPYSFSKSSNSISPVNKKAAFLREYKSSDENKFFRGAAIDVTLGNFNLSSFYSNNYFDANIDPLTEEILSVPVDGLHRTQNEILKKHTAKENFSGGILTYKIPSKLDLGILFYHARLSNSFTPKGVYDLKGDNFNYYSLSYHFYFPNISLSGENSFDGKSLASIINLYIELNSRISIISSVRNYPGNYANLHGSGFGEKNGGTKNEVGFYNGIRYRSGFGIFNFYFDQFKFPYPTPGSSFPSSGNEVMFNYEAQPFKYFNFNFRFKNEQKEITESNNTTKEIYGRNKASLRLDLTYQQNKFLRIKNRVELSWYKIAGLDINENGFLVFQDIRYLPINNLSLYGRIIFFKTDSFDTAIYEFENDLDGVFSVTGLSGEGTRWYILLKYKIYEVINLSLKYTELYKPKERTIGSGYSEVNGNFDNRLSFQIELKF